MKKKILTIFLFLIILVSLSSCDFSFKKDGPKDIELSNNNTVNTYSLKEQEFCFNFFWETQVTEDLDSKGLIPDRYDPVAGESPNNLASIASVGFGLAAFTVGVQNEWVTFEEAKERAIMTLTNVKELEKIQGFYYHFYDLTTGEVAPSEISVIDTAIFVIGALTAGEYFGGEVATLANEIYAKVNWPWYINSDTNQFYMAFNPNSGEHNGKWDTYGEQLMMYFLAAGSPTKKYRIDQSVYEDFTRYYGSYTSPTNGESYTFINSWFGSLFTYQFSHAFIDFRNIVDADGVDWYENSVIATKCARQYCIDNPEGFSELTHNKNSWGLTACDTPFDPKTGRYDKNYVFYSGFFGNNPTGFGGNDQTKNDGTMSLAGAPGSMPFLPEEVQSAIQYYYKFENGILVSKYGLLDSFNYEKDSLVATDVIGIDKGITCIMIENYRTGLIWDYLSQADWMKQAIEVLGFENK